MTLRALIVDDEPIARQRLKRFLHEAADVTLVGECADGVSAVAAIQKHELDLVFLDVQMPHMNGFEVVRAIGAEHMPASIFVTAFDQFALQAFEAQALDYLLKPFGDDRVRKALARARTFLDGAEHRAFQGRLTGLLATAADDPRRCILVKVGDRVVILRPSEIDWVEAEGDYVRLHVGQDSHFVRSTLAHMEAKLATEGFVRIHRSRLVNFQRVKELRPFFQGESVVVLKTGARLPASQSCLKNLQARFGSLL
jgi:two-component system, LytTR family, response regulator